MKKHSIILASYTLLFTLSEILYRFCFNIPNLSRFLETIAFNFLFVALYYFAKYRTTRVLIIIFFALSTIINNIHYKVYENWINSTNYLLAFTEITEITNAGVAMIGDVLPSLLWGIIETLLFISISRFRTKTSIFADGIFSLFFIYMFIRSFITDNDMGLTPRAGYSRIKANIYSFSSFIGRTIPYEFLHLDNLEAYHHPQPAKISAPKFRNIIFIVGESFSAEHAHVFGYEKETTPFLDQLSKFPNSLLKPTYAAGLGTAISLPTLFNAIPYPNGQTQIFKGDTNLFNLAKMQGFQTDFHSSQAEWEMEILGLIGKKWIDNVTFPTELGFSIHDSMNDHKTLPYLFNTDLSKGSHFFILHQRGSHMPYGKYLAEEDKKFKNNTPIDNYDNTVLDTDSYIRNVFEFLSKQKEDDWLLVYTSDHGQYVTNDVYNQGTIKEGSYIVPLMIYTPNQTAQKAIAEQFSQCKIMFHQQLSTLLISSMGYEMPISDCKSGVINGHLLTGNAGYLQVEQNNVKFIYPNKK